MTIIDAENKHAHHIATLIQEMAQHFNVNSPVTDDFVRKYLTTERSKVLLALKESQIIALLSYSIRPCLFHGGDAWYIEEVIVSEQWRDHNAGTSLLKEVICRAEKEQCVELSIAASHENEGALRLYRKMKFEDDSLLLSRHF